MADYRNSFAGLAVDHSAFSIEPLSSGKLDARKCEMEWGVVSPTVTVEETILLAAKGGLIGTELPSDQIP